MAKQLWKPSEKQIKNSNMYRFMNIINDKYDQNFSEYAGLYEWSIKHIDLFWETLWGFADIIASQPYDQVIDDVTKMPGARWFPGARLNFAENLVEHTQHHRLQRYFRRRRPEYLPRPCAYDTACRTCPQPLWPCWLPPAWVRHGPRVLPISASKACWIDSVRFSPRFCLPPTVTLLKEKKWIPWNGLPTF